MGEEAPQSLCENFIFESNNHQTATTIADKIYVIEVFGDGSKSLMNVKIFDKLSGKWLTPTVLGTQPIASKQYNQIYLDSEKILIVKKETPIEDCVWFLEVDTPFVKKQKELLETEVIAWSKGILGKGPKPVVISGPSGVGKGTLINKLMEEFPSEFGFSVSHTTRKPREREIDGVHYHFTERSVMEREIRDGKFLETASVHGNLYGTSVEAVEAVTDAGKRCILDIDVQGAKSVKATSLEAIFIFICPPSFEELENRLRSRGTETEEQVQKRLRNARTELDQAKSPGLFDHFLVNDDLETCYENLKKLLCLDEKPSAPAQACLKNFEGMVCRGVISNTGSKVMLQCGTTQSENAENSLLVLDLSSLKGGAPCHTRGLELYFADSIENF